MMEIFNLSMTKLCAHHFLIEYLSSPQSQDGAQQEASSAEHSPAQTLEAGQPGFV